MKKRIAVTLGLAGMLVMGFGCDNLKPVGSKTSASTSAGGKGEVKVEMYIMSKCPYGVKAVDGIKPVLDEIGSHIDLHLEYIVKEAAGKFTSLHGEPEVKGNIIQLCAIKNYPEQKKHHEFLSCWNKNWRAIPNKWETCADKAGMDKGRIKSCADGAEGKSLLRASMARATAAKASGSPTILINGKRYQGGRTKNDFMRAVCEKITTNKPAPCTKIPEDIEVEAIVLTDKRCKACQTAGLIANLKSRFFPKLKVKTLDYSDAEGKKLYTELGLKMLPVMLFPPGVEKAERYSNISRWMLPMPKSNGKYKQLRIPAKFDPTAEICDNKADDTGNGKIDCADPTCTNNLLCRKEIANKLDVFIMSQCPFGVKATDAMKEVLENFGTQVDFDVHFIADKVGDGFKALHGQPEVDENIRQLCAKKYYGRNNKYLDYIWCRNKNYRSKEWKPCATGGISVATIDKCFTGGEGKKLLEEDIKIAKGLGVSGSPTWLANNKFKFSGIAPEAIKSNVCRHNKGLKGCDKKLSASTGKPAGSCGK